MKAGLSREDVFVHRGGLLALLRLRKLEGLSREDVFVHRGGLLALLRLRKKG